jgi:hypothetical protein
MFHHSGCEKGRGNNGEDGEKIELKTSEFNNKPYQDDRRN